MPSFAELKAKAAGITSAGVEKAQNVRDRNTSVPLKKTNWDPYNGGPPPPPPPPRSNPNAKPRPPLLPPPSRTGSTASSAVSRTNSSSPAPALPSRSTSSGTPPPPPLRTPSISSPALPPRSSGSRAPPPPAPRGQPPAKPPPIVQRSTRPDGKSQQQHPLLPPPTRAAPAIDWANLSPEDKEVFFSWLDEFFAHFKQKLAAKSDNVVPQGKPPLRPANKPPSWSNSQAGSKSSLSDRPLSHPPTTMHGSAAVDLAHFFAPSTPWKEAWYNRQDSPSIPPPLEGDTHHTYMSSWRTWGSNKSVNIGVLFSDLSLFWGTVDYLTSNPEDPRTTNRKAVFIPPPKALHRAALVEAHETYNETIALFAESFLGSGQCCGRGECWDLANEALKYFADFDYIPKPVPSVSRTHGHLIYAGRASDRGKKLEGRWRGEDDRVRRGDVAEWRRVRIGRTGGFSTLGDPDHTAVIVADMVPKVAPRNGIDLSPADLGVMTVVEQSLGQLPEQRDYDLSRFEEGEMWIYRPIAMQVYLGISQLSAAPPDGQAGLQEL